MPKTKLIGESDLKSSPLDIGQDQCFCSVRMKQTGTEAWLSFCQGLPQTGKSGGKRQYFHLHFLSKLQKIIIEAFKKNALILSSA